MTSWHRIVLVLIPVQWVVGVLAMWLLPQRVGYTNSQPPDAAAWLVVAAIIAGQLAAVLYRRGAGVAPLVALVLGSLAFAAVTVLEAISHATLLPS